MPWTLDDAEALNREHPRSFFIPPREIRESLQKGDLVKLIFRMEREDGEVAVERMWVEVFKAGRPYVGKLENEPYLKGVLRHGQKISFGPEHVAAYAYTEGQLGYNADTDCFVSRRVVEADEPPARLHLDTDGAWQAFTGTETGEELREPVLWRLGYLTDRFPATADALREGAPPGTWWEWDGDRYVRT